MSHLFYDTFGMESIPLLFLCGDDSVELMRATLARELAGRGKSTLFVSDTPMPFPVEGQVLVDIKPDLLKQKIDPQTPGIFYLCSEVKDDLLMPLDRAFVTHCLQHLPHNVTLITTVKGSPSLLAGDGDLPVKYIFIHVFGYRFLEENFNRLINESDAQSDISFEDHLKNHWQKWAERYCPNFAENNQAHRRLLYLNQVKSLIDENHVISIVRNLTDMYDHIYIGDINEYKLKEI